MLDEYREPLGTRIPQMDSTNGESQVKAAMPRYKASQPAGFFDASERIEQLRRMQDPVLRLQEAVDWELFRPTLEALVAIVPKGPGGQRPFDPSSSSQVPPDECQ